MEGALIDQAVDTILDIFMASIAVVMGPDQETRVREHLFSIPLSYTIFTHRQTDKVYLFTKAELFACFTSRIEWKFSMLISTTHPCLLIGHRAYGRDLSWHLCGKSASGTFSRCELFAFLMPPSEICSLPLQYEKNEGVG